MRASRVARVILISRSSHTCLPTYLLAGLLPPPPRRHGGMVTAFSRRTVWLMGARCPCTDRSVAPEGWVGPEASLLVGRSLRAKPLLQRGARACCSRPPSHPLDGLREEGSRREDSGEGRLHGLRSGVCPREVWSSTCRPVLGELYLHSEFPQSVPRDYPSVTAQASPSCTKAGWRMRATRSRADLAVCRALL